MSEAVDRRRFLIASAATAAGTLLSSSKLEAAPGDMPEPATKANKAM